MRQELRLIAVVTAMAIPAACSVIPPDERFPDVSILRVEPDCTYETLGPVRAREGHNPVFGQSKEWATRARLDVAEAELRERAAKLGASAVIVTQRRLAVNDEGDYGYIDLRGKAISACGE